MGKKSKKKEKIVECIDCECETDDFYRIQTNRGDIIKCSKCYELWILRSSRMNATIHKNIKDED